MNFARHKRISDDRSLEVPLHGKPVVAEEPVQWPQDAHCCEFSFVFPGLSQTFLLIGYFFIGNLFDWFFDSDSQPKQVLDSDTTMAILFPSSTPVIFLFLYYKLQTFFSNSFHSNIWISSRFSTEEFLLSYISGLVCLFRPSFERVMLSQVDFASSRQIMDYEFSCNYGYFL